MTLKTPAILAAAAVLAAMTGQVMAEQSSSKMKSDLNMNKGATGASTGEQGKTSDRTPGDSSPQREPGSTKAGAPGASGAYTPEGTSDRTPKNGETSK